MRKKVNPMKLNLQFFAPTADPVPTPSNEPAPTEITTPVAKTFDEMLATSNYQSEFDKKVEKALSTAKATWNKEQEAIIAQRDKDLKELQDKLKGVEGSQEALQTLQTKYDEDAKNWKAAQEQQSYEFAIKSLASELEFTSQAAKNYFISQAVAKKLSMGNDGDVLGFKDYVESYRKDDPSAFKVVEDVPPAPANNPAPQIVPPNNPTPGDNNSPMSFLRSMTPVNRVKKE